MKMSIKSLIVYMMVQCIMLGFNPITYAQQPVTIDRLYPENWYTKALDYCMKVWGTFENILNKKNNVSDITYLLDASIGQLVFAKYCVRNIIHHKCVIGYDDLMHLSRVIGTIEDRYVQLSTKTMEEKSKFVHQAILTLRKKVELLLQTNQTITRASH
jgi:hypothetical protein